MQGDAWMCGCSYQTLWGIDDYLPLSGHLYRFERRNTIEKAKLNFETAGRTPYEFHYGANNKTLCASWNHNLLQKDYLVSCKRRSSQEAFIFTLSCKPMNITVAIADFKCSKINLILEDQAISCFSLTNSADP